MYIYVCIDIDCLVEKKKKEEEKKEGGNKRKRKEGHVRRNDESDGVLPHAGQSIKQETLFGPFIPEGGGGGSTVSRGLRPSRLMDHKVSETKLLPY